MNGLADKTFELAHFLMKDRSFWALSMCILLSSYYWYFVLTWVPSYLVLSKGFSNLAAWRACDLDGAVRYGSLESCRGVRRRQVGGADRRFPEPFVICCGWLRRNGGHSAAARCAGSSLGTSGAHVFNLCHVAMGNSSFWAIEMQWRAAGESHRAKSIGYLNTLSQIAGIIAPIVTGWMLGPQKQFGPAILVAGLCPLFAGMCLIATGVSGLDRTKALLAMV